MNKLVIVGWMGDRVAYLNISREDAIRYWRQSNPNIDDELKSIVDIKEFEFSDSFAVYDAWEIEEEAKP